MIREMKNKAQLNEDIDGIKHFIQSTCRGCTDKTSQYLDFHKNLVAHYFEARNVEIFYGKKKIVAEIRVGQGYVPLSFDCQDLSVFLSSCIKKDGESLKIYKRYIDDFTTIARTEIILQD